MEGIVVERTPIGFVGTYVDEFYTFKFEVTRVTEKDETIYGFLRVFVAKDGQAVPIYSGRVNLSGPKARDQLSKYLSDITEGKILKSEDWKKIVEAFCQKLIEKYYEPPSVERLRPASPELSFLWEPLLVKGYPTLVYAPGGSGKSIFAMIVAVMLQTGRNVRFESTDRKHETLYLDWEMDELEMGRRLNMLANGVVDFDPPYYMQCVLPLTEILDTVLQTVQEKGIEAVIVDSAAPAIGGDINDAGKVIEFFGAVRKLTALGTSVLILSHVSKQHKEKEDGALPIGSIFFENLSRLTWELKYTSEKNELNIALFCRKSNFGKMDPFGYRIIFENGYAFLFTLKKSDLLGINHEVTQKEIVLAALAERPATAKEIADVTGLPKEVVSKKLSELKAEGRVVLDGRVWRLA